MMHNTVFVGGGPGGLSPLISALQSGRFDSLVGQGVVMV